MRFCSYLLVIILSLTGNAFSEDVIQNSGKDMCLLDIKYCENKNYYNIVEKIVRIKAALAIGTKLYTTKEIEHLEYLYEESLYTCDRIECHPSQVPEMSDRFNN